LLYSSFAYIRMPTSYDYEMNYAVAYAGSWAPQDPRHSDGSTAPNRPDDIVLQPPSSTMEVPGQNKASTESGRQATLVLGMGKAKSEKSR
jgi:hypothetical protein